MVYCSYCGQPLPDGAAYCGTCGRPQPRKKEKKKPEMGHNGREICKWSIIALCAALALVLLMKVDEDTFERKRETGKETISSGSKAAVVETTQVVPQKQYITVSTDEYSFMVPEDARADERGDMVWDGGRIAIIRASVDPTRGPEGEIQHSIDFLKENALSQGEKVEIYESSDSSNEEYKGIYTRGLEYVYTTFYANDKWYYKMLLINIGSKVEDWRFIADSFEFK